MTSPPKAAPFSAEEQALLEQLGSLQSAPQIWQLPAIGWWLCGLLLLLVAIAIYIFKRRQRKQKHHAAYRQEALEQFRQLRQQAAHSIDINRLLKQFAMQCYGRSSCAALSGSAWLAFLQQQQPELTPAKSLHQLIQHQQGLKPTELPEDVLNYCQEWIKQAQIPARPAGGKHV